MIYYLGIYTGLPTTTAVTQYLCLLKLTSINCDSTARQNQYLAPFHIIDNIFFVAKNDSKTILTILRTV